MYRQTHRLPKTYACFGAARAAALYLLNGCPSVAEDTQRSVDVADCFNPRDKAGVDRALSYLLAVGAATSVDTDPRRVHLASFLFTSDSAAARDAYLGMSSTTPSNVIPMPAIAAAELPPRLRAVERFLAYDYARSEIETCHEVGKAEGGGYWYDTRRPIGATELSDVLIALEYLEARGLILRDKDAPHIVHPLPCEDHSEELPSGRMALM